MSSSVKSDSHQTSSWNSYSLIKKSAIVLTAGAVTGCVGYFAATYIAKICADNESELGKYFCMKSRNFFDPYNLARYTNPIVGINLRIAGMVEPFTSPLIWLYSFIGPVSFKSTNCDPLKVAMINVINKYKNSIISEDVIKAAHDVKSDIYDPCCNIDNAGQALASSFAEELVFRSIIQGILLPGLIKIGSSLTKLQGRVHRINNNRSGYINKVGEVVSHRYSRILVTSLIFAFCHIHPNLHDDAVAQHFVSSLIYSVVFEKYGIFGSTASHFVSNLFGYNFQKNQCIHLINGKLNVLLQLL